MPGLAFRPACSWSAARAISKEIESRGRKTLLPPEEVVPGPTIALFQDTHGRMVGLAKGE